MWSAPVWSLIGWWWGNSVMPRRLMSSDLRLQLVWGLHVSWSSYNYLLPSSVGFNTCKTIQECASDTVICVLWGELKILWLCYMTDLLFKLLPVLLAPLLFFVIMCSHFPNHNSWAKFLWLRKEAWETKAFLQTRCKWKTWGDLSWEGPIESCLVILLKNYFLS